MHFIFLEALILLGNVALIIFQLLKCILWQTTIDYLLKLSDVDNVIDCYEDINLKIIGERLLNIRKENKLSQRAIAHSININHSTWGAYERGQTLITLTSLYSLAKLYNISIDFILGRE